MPGYNWLAELNQSKVIPSVSEPRTLDVQFTNKSGKDLKISYPCVVLNVSVADHNTNEQYQTLVDHVTKRYETTSEMSIEFEVDGPYRVRIRLFVLCSSMNITALSPYLRSQRGQLTRFIRVYLKIPRKHVKWD